MYITQSLIPRLFALFILFLLSVSMATHAEDIPKVEWPSQYSADIVIKTQDLPGTMTIRQMVDGDKVRTETRGAGQEVISISRGDKKENYMIMPTRKMYMVVPVLQSPVPQIARDLSDPTKAKDVRPQYIGEETVNGIASNKYRIANKDGKISYIWISKTNPHPVRVASADGTMRMDWNNVSLTQPNPTLFEPPANFQRMEFPRIPGGTEMPVPPPGMLNQ